MSESRYAAFLLFLVLLLGPGRCGAATSVEDDSIDASSTAGRQTALGGSWSLLRPPDPAGRQIWDHIVARITERSQPLQLAEADPGEPETAAATSAGDQEKASLTEVNKQLSNPVTSFWSLTFQFNNYNLENVHWNHNMQFQPVLPISLTKDVNLINRPVIPVYNSVPRPIGPGKFRQTTAFGDMVEAEMFSPANSGPWLLALGPTFIFPTATSQFTGQGKYQIGPAGVLGYLSKDYIAGIFPQMWWSVSSGSRPAVAQMNLQPFGALFFGEGWSVGYSGNILANLYASTGQMWTVPIGLSLSKVERVGPLPVRFALAGQYMAVRPSDFGQEWNLQLIIAPVIPKLFGGTVF